MFRALVSLIIAMPIVYFAGRYMASKDCDNRHKVAQLEHEITVRKNNEKIDRKTPYNADRVDKFKWLREHSYQ